MKRAKADRAAWAGERARRVQASIQAAVDCPLCPGITPKLGIEILSRNGPLGASLGRLGHVSNVVRGRVEALAGDEGWRAAALGWVIEFWAGHGHGPTWRQFMAADFWPDELRLWMRETTMRALYRGGYLDGTRTPFGLKASIEPIFRRRWSGFDGTAAGLEAPAPEG